MIEIPGYYLKRTIGSGGMATVYLAVQESLEREVALKVMSPVLSADQTFATRFRREARTIARLSHPNIVPIFDVGTTADNHNYFSMQHLPGGTLSDRLDKPLDEMQIFRIFTGVLRALGFAHDLGFVHRDVKPENVLFDTSGTPMLTDFGIARALRSSTRITETGMSVGTSRYMSPEQARGGHIDARSDLYSIGVVLYEALTGKPPFEAQDTFAVAYAHVNEPVPPMPSECRDWEPVIQRAMAKGPDDRYPSAESMVAALENMARRHSREGVLLTGNGKSGLTRIFGNRGRSKRPWWKFWARKRPTAVTEDAYIPLAIPSAFSRRMLARMRPWLPPFLRRPVWRLVQTVDQRITRLWRRSGKRKSGSHPAFYLGSGLLVLALSAGLWYLAGGMTSDPHNPAQLPATPALSRAAGDLLPPAPAGAAVEQDPGTANPGPAAGGERQPLASAGSAASGEAARLQETVQSPPPVEPRAEAAEPTVAGLLAAAQGALTDYRLTTPAEDNALHYFQTVLRMEPQNERALAGMAAIVERYMHLVAVSRRDHEPVEAANYLLRAREVATGHGVDGALAVSLVEAQEPVYEALMALGRNERGQDPERAKEIFSLALQLLPGATSAERALASLKATKSTPRRFTDALVSGGSGPEMMVIPVGQFVLGNAQTGRAPVTISHAFAMSRYEVTVDDFRRFIEVSDYRADNHGCEVFKGNWEDSDEHNWKSPGFAQLGNQPVVCVSWRDAQAYVNWLSVQTGQSYRLPTEVEWEYALASATQLQDNVCRQANVGDMWLKNYFPRDEAFECADGTAYTAPVGSWPENDYGLYDLVGNVREWVLDCWHESHAGRPAGQGAWLSGDCDRRVIKGSSWITGRPDIEFAHRLGAPEDAAYNAVGFRVVRALEP